VLSILGYDAPFFAYGRALQDRLTVPFALNYTGNYQLLRGKNLLLFDGQTAVPSSESPVPSPSEEDLDFVKAFIQQYNNRLIDGQLTSPHIRP